MTEQHRQAAVSREGDAEPWHRHSVEETYARLASRKEGLTAEEVAQRRAQVGPNLLETTAPRSNFSLFAAQLADSMVLILVGAAIVSGMIGDLTDAVVIVAIVVLNAVLGFVQEFRAERAMAALKTMAAPTATVLRAGEQKTVPAADLVPGDVVLIESGRIVPADLRLVEVASLRVDESALTGESVPVDKLTEALRGHVVPVGDRHNIAHKGSIVTYGRAAGLVIATGMRTEFGRIAQLLRDARSVQTPLQRRLAIFGRQLALVVLVICGLVFLTGLVRGEPPLPMFLVALSLAVAAIPEALPAIVSISLALGARKMLAQRALVRRLSAVDTLGSVTFICSDKTGTLTANEMRAERYYCDGRETHELADSLAARTLLQAMAVSHDAAEAKDGRVVGDPTEVALLMAARDAGLDSSVERMCSPRVAELPFDSDRKRMTTVHREADGSFLAITKGAAEVVIALSKTEQQRGGAVEVNRAVLTRAADSMAAEGLRVLAVGVRRWASLPPLLSPDSVERDLEFIGLVGLIDPPRPEVAEAVAACKSAGVVPVMITGDHP